MPGQAEYPVTHTTYRASTGGYFHKAHLDCMMLKASRFDHLVQVRCALTGYTEWHMLRKENAKSLSAFIFKELLCCLGPITEIVTCRILSVSPRALTGDSVQFYYSYLCYAR